MINSIKDKLRLEFVDLKQSVPVSQKFDFTVVFSAEENDISGENKTRLMQGLKLSKKETRLIYLGTKTHNQNVKVFLREKHPKTLISYPVKRQEASTKTQVKDLAKFLKEKGADLQILMVSHSYHIPRIKRYCKKYMPRETNIIFFGIGKITAQKKQVNIEIKKIINYAKKGDLPLFIS